MNSLSRTDRDRDQDERAIGSLCARTGATRADVRVLFAREHDRLALGATVRSYLRLLATANVYAMLRDRATESLPLSMLR